MSDERLHELGEVAAEQRRELEASRWTRLTRGELSPEEIAALEAEAALDEEAAYALGAARPLDDAARARIASHLTSRIAPRDSGARVVMLRRVVGFAAGAVAVAAGAMLVATRGPHDEALPRYDVEVLQVATARRAGAGEVHSSCVVRADRGGSFEVLLRAEVPARGVAARAFVARGDEIAPWAGALEISDEGSVRILDDASKLRDVAELRVVVGRARELEGERAASIARGPAAAGGGWQLVRCVVELTP